MSAASCGVSERRTSPTGAAALAISDTGAAIVFSTSPSRHAVFIDNESLPTGTLMPSAWQTVLAACTASKSFASSPGWPHAAIQFAESFTRSSAMSAAAMLVIASPMAIRDAAAASMTASGVRSPIAIASPA